MPTVSRLLGRQRRPFRPTRALSHRGRDHRRDRRHRLLRVEQASSSQTTGGKSMRGKRWKVIERKRKNIWGTYEGIGVEISNGSETFFIGIAYPILHGDE